MKLKVQSSCPHGFRLGFLIASILLMLSSVLVSTPDTGNSLMTPIGISQSTLSANPPRLNLTYYTLANPTEIAVLSGSVISGDHVILRSEWSASVVNKSRLEVVASAIPATIAVQQNTPVLVIDTRSLGNNATCLINSTAWLTNGTVISIVYQNVYIGNYFAPAITVLSPNGGEEWTGVNTIRWHAYDINIGDSLRYDVRISSDSGVTFETVASSIAEKWYNWNSSQYDKLDTYIVEIRATDGIYFSYDRSDSPFIAGEVPTNATTTSTTTSNNTTPIDYRIATFIVVLLSSSIVMALVVYYVAKKWF